MKKTGVMNSEISKIIACMGHTDILVICDSGYSIPPNVLRVDLALKRNQPSILDTVQEIAKELQVEKITYADESRDHCPKLIEDVLQTFSTANSISISHQAFKELAKSAVAIIRTGECTAFSNVILHAGVAF